MPRRIGDHDLFWWLDRSGFLDATVESLPDPRARLWANVITTGHRGGHDLHLRTLHELGVILLGHLAGSDGRAALFEPDLAASLAWGDERYAMLRELFGTYAGRSGVPIPELPDPAPLDYEPPEEVDLSQFGAVVHAGGFRTAYESWVDIPGAFDELGFPLHESGESTVAPGLHFVGVHFLRTRKSSLLIGVGDDAGMVASRIAERSASG